MATPPEAQSNRWLHCHQHDALRTSTLLTPATLDLRLQWVEMAVPSLRAADIPARVDGHGRYQPGWTTASCPSTPVVQAVKRPGAPATASCQASSTRRLTADDGNRCTKLPPARLRQSGMCPKRMVEIEAEGRHRSGCRHRRAATEFTLPDMKQSTEHRSAERSPADRARTLQRRACHPALAVSRRDGALSRLERGGVPQQPQDRRLPLPRALAIRCDMSQQPQHHRQVRPTAQHGASSSSSADRQKIERVVTSLKWPCGRRRACYG